VEFDQEIEIEDEELSNEDVPGPQHSGGSGLGETPGVDAIDVDAPANASAVLAAAADAAAAISFAASPMTTTHSSAANAGAETEVERDLSPRMRAVPRTVVPEDDAGEEDDNDGENMDDD
jgi:hypothetical protein